jgi:hypothetical protein
MVLGGSGSIGDTQYGASIGIIDYSKKTTDDYGLTTFEVRTYARKMNARLQINPQNLNAVYSLLSAVRGTACVWVAVDDQTGYEAMIVYGWARDFNIDIALPAVFFCTLQIEGLT